MGGLETRRVLQAVAQNPIKSDVRHPNQCKGPNRRTAKHSDDDREALGMRQIENPCTNSSVHQISQHPDIRQKDQDGKKPP